MNRFRSWQINQKRVQGWEKQCKHTLYWFTHNELHPILPYSKVEFTKNQLQSITTHNISWTLQEPYNQSWKTLFQHTLHSKKLYQEVTHTTTFTNKN